MPPSPTPAPWRAPFLAHLSTLGASPTFTLATLHTHTHHHHHPGQPGPPAPAVTPRARTCVFRGLWATLPDNPHNAAPRNPRVYESDLPVFTTDARSEKVAAGGLLDDDYAGAAGAGPAERGTPVEACFWVERVRTQWRVRGRAYVLGGGGGGAGGRAEAAERREEEVRRVLLGRMRRVSIPDVPQGEEREQEGSGGLGWSFEREVTGHFGNLSPLMRGSFRGPAPGTPIAAEGSQREGEELGQKVDDLEDAGARRNFRVVVIVPEEVDQVDLSNELRPRRWLYVYRGVGGEAQLAGGEVIGEWEKVEVWP
ncbi:hypothetical protein VTK26DRAFT_8224 [Humicola hyalothermophila]